MSERDILENDDGMLRWILFQECLEVWTAR